MMECDGMFFQDDKKATKSWKYVTADNFQRFNYMTKMTEQPQPTNTRYLPKLVIYVTLCMEGL